jgi:hypothetical protein
MSSSAIKDVRAAHYEIAGLRIRPGATARAHPLSRSQRSAARVRRAGATELAYRLVDDLGLLELLR